MSALLIGPEEKAKIEELRGFARANPLDPFRTIAAADPTGGNVRDMMDMYSIELPVGYHVTYSQEHQPYGLCHHVSVSIDSPHRRIPHPEAVEMILEAFGMAPLKETIHVWIEVVDDTTKAINVAQMVRPT
jgi:hypothetical protein